MQGQIFINECDKIDCAVWMDNEIQGCSWNVSVRLSGPTDDNNFVYDFSDLKNLVKNTLKETIDHALVIPDSFQAETPNNYYFPGGWHYQAPEGAVISIPSKHETITKNDVQKACEKIIQQKLGEKYTLSVELTEEANQNVFFRYTHGITGHQGACQRTFHGHRSKLIANVNGERNRSLEIKIVAELLKSSCHIISKNQITKEDESYYHLLYEGSYGTFKASVPKKNSLVIEQETSIEAITLNIGKQAKRFLGIEDKLELSCFEGVDKGATVIL